MPIRTLLPAILCSNIYVYPFLAAIIYFNLQVCPLGPYYLPSYAGGVRAGIQELGPQILGENPVEIDKLNHRMDYLLKGHPYVKSPIDMACWDILGKVSLNHRPIHMKGLAS